MLCVTYQFTASKIVPQTGDLNEGQWSWVKEQLNHAKSIASFLFVCVCVCLCVCVCEGESKWADEPTFVRLKPSASPHISSFSAPHPVLQNLAGHLSTLATQYGVVLSHQRSRCQTWRLCSFFFFTSIQFSKFPLWSKASQWAVNNRWSYNGSLQTHKTRGGSQLIY